MIAASLRFYSHACWHSRYEVISRCPSYCTRPALRDRLRAWTCLVVAMVALAAATTHLLLRQSASWRGVGRRNAVGGYVVTERILKRFVAAGKKSAAKRTGTLAVDASRASLATIKRSPSFLSHRGRAVHSSGSSADCAGHFGERSPLGRSRHAASPLSVCDAGFRFIGTSTSPARVVAPSAGRSDCLDQLANASP